MKIEQAKKILLSEQFEHVYEWTDGPGVTYPEHAHKGRVSFFVIEGSILMNIAGEVRTVQVGERMDVPVGVIHSAKVGNTGCSFVVGEEIEGDS